MGIYRSPVDSPHKGSVMQQAYQNHDIHYNDVIMGAMTSKITILTIVYSTVYSDADKENIKAPRHWSLCGEFTDDRWNPRTNGQ